MNRAWHLRLLVGFAVWLFVRKQKLNVENLEQRRVFVQNRSSKCGASERRASGTETAPGLSRQGGSGAPAFR